MTKQWICLAASAALAAAACTHPTPTPIAAEDAAPDAVGATPATAATRDANAKFAQLPLADAADFADAQRGLIAHEDGLVIKSDSGAVIWDTTAYGFLAGDAPASVNPSL